MEKKFLTTKFFDSITMLKFGKDKSSKKGKEFYGAKKTIKIWDVDIDNIVISKLIEINEILSIWISIYMKL